MVRRVTGRPLSAFFAEEVAGPLGADFHIGLPAGHDHRVAPVIAPPSAPSGSRLSGGPPNPAIQASDGNTLAWRRAGIPSAGGYGNARSVGAVQSVLACGGTARGVRLLSQAGCERAREEQYRGQDQVLGASMRYGMGYGIFGDHCGWGGWGGALVMVDLDAWLPDGLLDGYRVGRRADPARRVDRRADQEHLVHAVVGAVAGQVGQPP